MVRARVFLNGQYDRTAMVSDGEAPFNELFPEGVPEAQVIVYVHDTFWGFDRDVNDWRMMPPEDTRLRGLYAQAVAAERKAAGVPS